MFVLLDILAKCTKIEYLYKFRLWQKKRDYKT